LSFNPVCLALFFIHHLILSTPFWRVALLSLCLFFFTLVFTAFFPYFNKAPNAKFSGEESGE